MRVLFQRIFFILGVPLKWDYRIIPSKFVSLRDTSLWDEKIPRLNIQLEEVALLISTEVFRNEYISYNNLLKKLKQEFPEIEEVRLSKDLYKFMVLLNQNGLVNFYPITQNLPQKFWGITREFLLGNKYRYDIPKMNAIHLFYKMVKIILRCYFYFILFVVVSALILYSISNTFFDVRLSFMYLLLILYTTFCFLVSILIHESTHLIMYRKISKSDKGYISTRRLGISLVREKLPRKQSIPIRISGALVTCIIGILLFILPLGVWMKIPAIIFLLHIINLLPIIGDGHEIFSELLES
jgi:hypothetical protein